MDKAELINFIMLLQKFDKNTNLLEGLKWYCRAQNLPFNENDNF